MSLYNMMNGVNTLCVFFILPMLGKHPDEYPRFRDCFLGNDLHPEYDNHIYVLTRVGGENRGQGFGEEELMKHPNFINTYDEVFDSTYGVYIFSVPEEWKLDFEKVKNGNLQNLSLEYKNKVREVYPKLVEKLNEVWGGIK